ncbi:MAG: hypothetical protein IPO19_19625 [Rhodoferax sp.]|nr:hypothetical protein [Rhodoferax sp.]
MQTDRWALKLRKWYLDGVTPAGDVCIGYQAQLQAGPLATGYRGLLLRSAQGVVEDHSGGQRRPGVAARHWSEW